MVARWNGDVRISMAEEDMEAWEVGLVKMVGKFLDIETHPRARF